MHKILYKLKKKFCFYHFYPVFDPITVHDMFLDLIWSSWLTVLVAGYVSTRPDAVFKITRVASLLQNVFETIFVSSKI